MKKGWLILIGVIAVVLILVIGAAAGGAVTYFLLRDDLPRVYASPWITTGRSGKGEGMVVAQVMPGSPADEAGLVRGDILIEVEGKSVNSLAELRLALRDYNPGDSVSLMVLHGDDNRTLIANLDSKSGIGILGIIPCLGPTAVNVGVNKNIKIITNGGAVVTEVIDESPADNAGIKIGDIILAVDKDQINSDSSLSDLIKAHQPGDKVRLVVSRDGKRKNINLRLGENPEDPDQAYLGVYYQSGGDQVTLDFNGEEPFLEMPFRNFEWNGQLPPLNENIPFPHGFENLPEGYDSAIIIGRVLEGSPAETSGLQVQDLILEVNGEAVDTLDSFVDDIGSFKPGDKITLLVHRGDELVKVQVTLGENPDNPDLGYLGVEVSGFVHFTVDGDMPDDFKFNNERELTLPGGDA